MRLLQFAFGLLIKDRQDERNGESTELFPHLTATLEMKNITVVKHSARILTLATTDALLQITMYR